MTRTARLVVVTSAMLVGSFQVWSPAALAAPPPAPVASQSATYIVRAGDNLVTIARKLGVRLAALLSANSLTVSSTIHPGNVLIVPTGSPTATPTATGSPVPVTTPVTTPVTPPVTAPAGSTTYVVRSGDALASIAQRHGVKLGALVKANNITVTSVILPGQTLRIPQATMQIPVPRSQPTPPAAAASHATASSTQVLVAYLRAQVGKPYKFFTAGPDTFDCSGLVVAAYEQVGVALPHQSRALAGVGAAIDWRSTPIVAGDLVFTSSTGDPASITHVGIALDSTTWIQAVGPGRTVRIASLPQPTKIIAVRRLPQP